MILRTLTLDECQQVRIWRDHPSVLPGLRTGSKTDAEQTAFYHDVICNPAADHRYWALEHDGDFIGMGGMTYLSRVPGEAEISLVIDPARQREQLGTLAVIVLAEEAARMGLACVIGECYRTGPVGFWQGLTSLSPRAEGIWIGDSYRFWWLVR